MALAIELFTDGSFNTFAKPTNVDTNARILCYDIRDLASSSCRWGCWWCWTASSTASSATVG